jgi:seryl-tRNA synthetase
MAKATNDLFLSSSGLATFGSDGVKIIEWLEGHFLSWAEEFGAEKMMFPPLMRVEDLNRIDYFRNFPHLGVLTSGIQENWLKNYIKGGDVGMIPNTHLGNSNYALLSAACYPIYFHLQNQVLNTPRYITVLGQCFRNESYYQGLERLLSFRLREIVCVGSDLEVKSFLARCKEKILAFAAEIGLPLEVKVASDPFFEADGVRAKMQKRFPVKEEFVYEGMALASVNFHLNFFGERCDIRTEDEKFAFSGCVGMGIERWVGVLAKKSKIFNLF